MIAVNRAALRFACHWWAALDFQTVQRDEPAIVSDPQLLTRAAYRPKYVTRSGIDVELLDCKIPGFSTFSATAALVLAAHLGAKEIQVFGADWTEAPDFDGVMPVHAARGETRWGTERLVWAAVCEWLSSKSVTVNRHTFP